MSKLNLTVIGLALIAFGWPFPAVPQTREATALDAQINRLFNAGQYQEAIPLAQRLLEIQEKAFGPDNPKITDALYNLATLNGYQGNYADAENLYQRVMAIHEKSHGPDNPSVADVADSLAYTYKQEGRYADAEPLFQRALAIRQKALRPDHPDVANSLANMADL
jgi:tetratricopeptide (TPR) repeat protein